MEYKRRSKIIRLHACVVLVSLARFRFCSSFSTSTSTCASSDELRALAKESMFKKRGSKNYLVAWRQWTAKGINHIQYELSKNLPHPVVEEEFQSLWHELGVAADVGKMPSFSNAGSRSGYAINFFCRALLLADILHDRNNLPPFMLESLEEKLFLDNCNDNIPKTLKLASLGGGPGYDFVSAVLVSNFESAISDAYIGTSIDAIIFDYEEGWSDIVDAMSLSTQAIFSDGGHKCVWGGRCDITVPLLHRSNESCRQNAPLIDLWVCQYCVAENTTKLRQQDYVFFADLFKLAKVGALFVFTETTPRLWPDFVDLITELGGDEIEISFLGASGRGNCGPQMVLRKSKMPECGLDEKTRLMLDNFRSMNTMHERKMEKGFVRQIKKDRG